MSARIIAILAFVVAVSLFIVGCSVRDWVTEPVPAEVRKVLPDAPARASLNEMPELRERFALKVAEEERRLNKEREDKAAAAAAEVENERAETDAKLSTRKRKLEADIEALNRAAEQEVEALGEGARKRIADATASARRGIVEIEAQLAANKAIAERGSKALERAEARAEDKASAISSVVNIGSAAGQAGVAGLPGGSILSMGIGAIAGLFVRKPGDGKLIEDTKAQADRIRAEAQSKVDAAQAEFDALQAEHDRKVATLEKLVKVIGTAPDDVQNQIKPLIRKAVGREDDDVIDEIKFAQKVG